MTIIKFKNLPKSKYLSIATVPATALKFQQQNTGNNKTKIDASRLGRWKIVLNDLLRCRYSISKDQLIAIKF